MEIKYTTYKNIDKAKWDNCILNATNHLIYAEAWYLDIVCPENWNALILNDYEAVMPLPLKSKMGLTYVQQPIWTQQLGVFSTLKVTEQLTKTFLQAIPKKMVMVSLNLNEINLVSNIELVSKTNLILDLNNSYETLKSNFSSNTKRNINKANKGGLAFDLNSKDVNGFFDFFKSNIQNTISDTELNILINLVEFSINNNKGFLALVMQENEIVAASFMLKSNKRIIYRTGTSNQKGKQLKAMFLLVNELIQQHANSNCKLDFEGSEIKGVARFYKGFGSQNTPYFYYKNYNNMLLKVFEEMKLRLYK